MVKDVERAAPIKQWRITSDRNNCFNLGQVVTPVAYCGLGIWMVRGTYNRRGVEESIVQAVSASHMEAIKEDPAEEQLSPDLDGVNVQH